MEESTVEVHTREETGKNANRRLRATGQVPAVVYGAGKDSLSIQVETRQVKELLKSASGENTVFLLKLSGTDKSRHTMIRELQTDSITGEMIHIDFQRVMLDQVVRVNVPVELQGEAFGVHTDGGILDFVTREVAVECLPGNIPPAIVLDVSELLIGQHVEAGQLEMPESVTMLEDVERVIVSIAQRKLVEEVVEEDEGLLTAEAEEPEVVGEAPETED